jgi:hypothetical protein
MKYLFLLVALFVVLFPTPSMSGDLSGELNSEIWLFPVEPLYEGQRKHNESLSLELEYFLEISRGSSISFVPFIRYDRVDSERTHFDIRELNYYLVLDNIEIRAGIAKVFWGATEFVHLVDIINQKDLMENPFGDEKLGQPMVQIIKPFDWGSLELFILPYFRERSYPGQKGRFRPAIIIDMDMARYEHDDKEQHTDFASRLSGTVGAFDIGVSYFKGTGREPTLLPSMDSTGSPILVPYYEQIEQYGADMQAVVGSLLLKLEAIKRIGQAHRFHAYSYGAEYTFNSVFNSGYDLGVIGEHAYDSRGEDASSGFQNDIMLGLRLALNDFSGTEVLAGYIHDMDYNSNILRVEGSRRFGDKIKLSFESGTFINIESEEILYGVRNDDYFMIAMSYYFNG